MGFNLDTQATRSALMSVDTTLAANIDATQDYIPVASTANFSTSVVAEVETTNEVVSFTDISENLFSYSQEFDNATWSKSNTTVTADNAVAPDGTTTAELITENSTGSPVGIFISEAITTVIGTQYTISVFAKRNGRDLQIAFGSSDVTGNPYANFNLSTGALGTTGGTITASITDAGNSWYRCSVIVTSAVTSLLTVIVPSNSTTATRLASHVGDGTSGIYLWGAQLEAGTLTTYLPTTSAALVGLTGVTRGANGTTAASASSGDDIQQLPYALLNVDMPVRLTGLSVSSDGTGAGRLTLCDKVGTHLCDVDINEDEKFTLNFGGGILFPNGIYVANSDNLTAYTLYTDKYSGDSL